MVNNADWLKPLPLTDFLRDVGKHFTLSYMLQKESVKGRMEEGISYTEFSYMLLQAFDFLQLFRTHKCEMQMGGSDQWGNITAGVELIRRTEGMQAQGLSAPLITTASGAKFGKTEGGTLWLDPELTSPYQFFQFWINSDDRDVEKYLRMFTFKTKEEIAKLMLAHNANPGKRIPHNSLADELTTRVHDADTAGRVAQAAKILFGQIDEPRQVPGPVWAVLAKELPGPQTPIPLPAPVPSGSLFVDTGLVSSKGEMKRQIEQGALYINGLPIVPSSSTGPNDVLDGGYLWLRKGKKDSYIVKIEVPSTSANVP
jgi:tyrosyl-tRNA synthetase